MPKYIVQPTNVESVMRDEDFIVSKTDLKGNITYCNQTFIEFAKYSEKELLGKPHSIIRHPDMPRAVFKLLWDTVKSNNEINAYVKNMASDGSFYWVFANVTPVINELGNIVGYYSVRRKPNQQTLNIIKDLYSTLLDEEKKYSKNGDDLIASTNLLNDILNKNEVEYEKFILEL